MRNARWLRVLAALFLLGVPWLGRGFVLMGPPDPREANPPSGHNFNYTAEFGGPKDIRRFFRWNIPQLVYSFDASFVTYFGLEGLAAVQESFDVINDFFHNEDYSGMSGLDLARHGFAGNHATYWENTTARNRQIIDIRSLALGMLVNQLGLGNPHRHAFSITGVRTNQTSSRLIFSVLQRNYDPVTHEETNIVNGVKYSYRLVHDAATNSVGTLPAFTIADMEEFTTDTSAAAWSSVAAIPDAFYGSTALYWTDTPTRFNFGVYYDGANAMGGQYQPRHALTYDDAGGLKYLYASNNFSFEDLDLSVTLVEPAQFLAPSDARHFPNANGGILPAFPRGATLSGSRPFNFPLTSRLRGMPILGYPGTTATNVVLVARAMRPGVDRIQFHYRPFDSLLGTFFIETNYIWTDTFVSTNANNVGGLRQTASGASAHFLPSTHQLFTQKIGRTVNIPDILIMADDVGWTNGVPIAFDRTTTNGWSNNAFLQPGFVPVSSLTNRVGPGIIGLPGTQPITWRFNRLIQDYEVVWSGENSVVGNLDKLQTFWGWIRGPGPNDIVTFPTDGQAWQPLNEITPVTEPPVITMVSDDGGSNPIEAKTLVRTRETLTLIGNNLGSVKGIEILSGDVVLQTLVEVSDYIVSGNQIDIPPGVLSNAAEGAALEVRAWNTVGPGNKGPQKFKIETGPPVITGTNADNIVMDRAQALTLRGYGFLSRTAGETRIAYLRVDDSEGSAVDDNGTSDNGISTGQPRAATIEVISDSLAELRPDSITAFADGSGRRLRVARKVGPSVQDSAKHLSLATSPLFTAITSRPVINTLSQLQEDNTWEDILATGTFKRDRVVEINGTALNTVRVIEVVHEDGSSFTNPVFIQLPAPGVSIDDNGTRIQLSAGVIPYADADTNGTARRAFKIYNAVGNTDLNATLAFAVNTQPRIDGLGVFTAPGYFNRDKEHGDTLYLSGSGFKSVGRIVFTDANDTAQSRISIGLPSPGVTVSDAAIALDSRLLQVGAAADTDGNSSRRIIRLESARDSAHSPMASRFYVGAPPSMGTLGALSLADNWRRDAEALEITGAERLGHLSRVDIVDAAGNPIAGLPALVPGAGVLLHNATAVTVSANATGWASAGHLLDSVSAASRRLKLTTPFGQATLPITSAFSLSASPAFAGSPFAGGGFNADQPGVVDVNGTYDKSDGDLYLHGEGFRGVATIYFGEGEGAGFTEVSGGTVQINPSAPPTGISFSADGTQIIISSANVPAAWIASSGNHTVRLRSVGDVNATTKAIRTQP
ncbi:MAG: hypothetical protein CMO74_15280 [Verrucomicrobiales bacterium]|nr:hypothetical protein [Verrucomicrobiales bacterium]